MFDTNVRDAAAAMAPLPSYRDGGGPLLGQKRVRWVHHDVEDGVWEVYTDAEVAAEERASFALDPPVGRSEMFERIRAYRRHLLKAAVGVLGVHHDLVQQLQPAPQSTSVSMDNLSDVEKGMMEVWTAAARAGDVEAKHATIEDTGMSEPVPVATGTDSGAARLRRHRRAQEQVSNRLLSTAEVTKISSGGGGGKYPGCGRTRAAYDGPNSIFQTPLVVSTSQNARKPARVQAVNFLLAFLPAHLHNKNVAKTTADVTETCPWGVDLAGRPKDAAAALTQCWNCTPQQDQERSRMLFQEYTDFITGLRFHADKPDFLTFMKQEHLETYNAFASMPLDGVGAKLGWSPSA